MKYVQKTTKKIKSNFLTELLLDRKILKDDATFIQKYFSPTKENELSPDLLDNIA